MGVATEEMSKNFVMWTSWEGGQQVRTPSDEGGGGVKKGQIFADVLYGWPLSPSAQDMVVVENYDRAVRYVQYTLRPNVCQFLLCC